MVCRFGPVLFYKQKTGEEMFACLVGSEMGRRERNGMEWNGMIRNGIEWNEREWNGMEWNGMEWNRSEGNRREGIRGEWKGMGESGGGGEEIEWSGNK